MNTRKYPRTLNEAFSRTAEYGAAIEKPAKTPTATKAVNIALAVGVIAIIFSLCFQTQAHAANYSFARFEATK